LLLFVYLLQISGHPVIAPHLTKMFGIRNGIDQELWDPSIDEHLPQNYGPEDVVQGKAAAKRELRRRGNLADVDVPLVHGVGVLLACACSEEEMCCRLVTAFVGVLVWILRLYIHIRKRCVVGAL
jgi:hypothetical protein